MGFREEDSESMSFIPYFLQIVIADYRRRSVKRLLWQRTGHFRHSSYSSTPSPGGGAGNRSRAWLRFGFGRPQLRNWFTWSTKSSGY
jgi:hypothetical protein